MCLRQWGKYIPINIISILYNASDCQMSTLFLKWFSIMFLIYGFIIMVTNQLWFYKSRLFWDNTANHSLNENGVRDLENFGTVNFNSLLLSYWGKQIFTVQTATISLPGQMGSVNSWILGSIMQMFIDTFISPPCLSPIRVYVCVCLS